MIKLQAKIWGDEYISGYYFVISANDKEIYETPWYDSSDEDFPKDAIEELSYFCDSNGLTLYATDYQPENWFIKE